MELTKAKELINILLKDKREPFTLDEHEAIHLGEEAIERFINKASLTYAGMLQPLPSETPPVSADITPRQFYLDKATGAITPKPTKLDPNPPTFAFSHKPRSQKLSDGNPDRHATETRDLNPPKSLKSTTSSPNQQKPLPFIGKCLTTAPQLAKKGVVY